MYVVSYQYRVPTPSIDAYLRLQHKVSAVYRAHGCRRYVVLRPTAADGEWMEFSVFDSAAAHQTCDDAVMTDGELAVLFREFLTLTGLSEDRLVQKSFTVAIDETEQDGG